MDSLGKYIKELREQKGITLNSFAKEIGVSTGNASEWETKGKIPRPEVLKKIAEYFDIDFEILRNLKKGVPVPTGKIKAVHSKEEAISEEIRNEAFRNVATRKIAKLITKVYNLNFDDVLDEWHQDELLEISMLVQKRTLP